jgi:antirestriction protein ArdC
MKFQGKAEQVANKLIEAFKEGKVPTALAQMFIQDKENRHCSIWSWNNQLITYLMGYSDARTFKQWQAVGRNVKKGEKSFHIFAPMTRKGTREKDGKKEEFNYVAGFYGCPVFGYEQTEGEPITYAGNKHIETLPLIEVANAWGIEVSAYNGTERSYRGVYIPMFNQIKLGVKNLSTWTHELVHAAEDKLGVLTSKAYKDDRTSAEIVAEMGGCVLLQILGYEVESDVGGCYEYISTYARAKEEELATVCYQLVNRICNAVNLILIESEQTDETPISNDCDANLSIA